MLRIEDSNVVLISIKASTKARPSRATIVLNITIVVYSIVIRNVIRNNIEVSQRRILSLRVVILVIIKARDILEVLLKTSSEARDILELKTSSSKVSARRNLILIKVR